MDENLENLENFENLLFEYIPNELISQILHYSTNIRVFSNLSHQFDSFYQSDEFLIFLRCKVGEQTGLVVDNYNLETLMRLYKYQRGKNIFTGNTSCIRTKNNNLYSLSMGGSLLQLPEFSNTIQIEGPLILNKFGHMHLHKYYENSLPIPIELDNIIQIANGSTFGFALTSYGLVYKFDTINRYDSIKPTLITGLTDIVSISSGRNYALALDINGKIYMFEYSPASMGIMCRKDFAMGSPVLILELNDIVAISANDWHALALTEDGNVYGFGSNNCGQLGLKVNKLVSGPIMIPGLSNIKQIEAGINHSLVINDQGQVYGFGNVDFGQFDVNCTRDPYLIYSVRDRNVPRIIPNITNIIQISSKMCHTLMLSSDGQIYTFDLSKSNSPTLIPNFQI